MLRNIFLAEDDEDDLSLFQEAVIEFLPEINLIHAWDGEDLMIRLRHADVSPSSSMLFLDINMPKKNGIECLREIRQTEILKALPVIVVSTSTDGQMISKTYEAGANLFIPKSNDFLQYKSEINKVLSSGSFGQLLSIDRLVI